MNQAERPDNPAIPDAVLAGISAISADAIICVDDSQRIIFFNEGAETIFGYSPTEIIGQPLERLIPQRYHAIHASHVRTFGESPVRARKMGERGQILGLRKSGDEFPAEAAISHLVAEGRKVYSVVLRDVTDLRRAHETQRFLAEAGERLASSLGRDETLQNIAQLAVPALADACVVNSFHDGQFHGAAVAHRDPNRAVELERERKEHPIDVRGGHPVAEVIRTLMPITWSEDEQSAGIKERFAPELMDVFPTVPGAAIIVPLIARNQLLGVIGLYRKEGSYDDNDRFLANELGRRAALAMDNARLHDLVRVGIQARDDMIGIVSHDLRNPVNAVKMLTGVMLDSERTGNLPPEMAQYTSVIRQAAVQMDGLIRDLLDVTRIEAGKLTVAPRRENTEELLGDALRTLAPVASEQSVGLKLDAPDDMPDVIADRERIMQAISNLVGNSVKFSPAGGNILVRVAVLAGELLISVTDEGMGMTPQQLAHAFDRFWQSSRTDRQGAGLGLAIAKGIIEAHQGRIWAESALGSGSTFYFTLPTAS